MINENENEAEMKDRSQNYDVNRSRPRHGQRYTKYKICLSIIMY